MKTPFAWRIAIFGENCWAASVSETRAIVRQTAAALEAVFKSVDANGAWMTV